MTLDEIRYALGSALSMAPAPWSWNRERVECANGNEIFPNELIEYLNMTFKALPALLNVAEKAQRATLRPYLPPEAQDPLIPLGEALEALEDLKLP